MILGHNQNDTELVALIPSIRNNMREWQIVTVMLKKSCSMSQADVIQKLLHSYKDEDGVIYPINDRKIVCIIRLGVVNSYSSLKTDVERKMPEHSCRVLARKMSPSGLKQIQIDITDKDEALNLTLFEQRDQRKENILMLADDDMFIRKAMNKILGFYGDVVEVDNGNDVLKLYLEHNPDVILLDIHMPGKNGLELIDQIFETDADAFIIIFSADSVKDNVLTAIENGAVGFLSKPPNQEKVSSYLNQCITIQ